MEVAIFNNRGRSSMGNASGLLIFPGYLLVRCLLDDESWAVLRNTPGVTGFAGPGSRPAALRRREVEQFLGPATAGPGSDKDEPVVVLGYGVGETVQVTRGPFTGLDGLVTELSEDKLTLTVLLDVFGRETPVVLDAADVTGSNVV